MVFETVEAAQVFVEPPDISEGVAYDAEGRLLGFDTDGRRTFLRERKAQPSHEEDLRQALAQVFQALDIRCDPAASLDELVERALSDFRAQFVGRHSRTLAQPIPLYARLGQTE